MRCLPPWGSTEIPDEPLPLRRTRSVSGAVNDCAHGRVGPPCPTRAAETRVFDGCEGSSIGAIVVVDMPARNPTSRRPSTCCPVHVPATATATTKSWTTPRTTPCTARSTCAAGATRPTSTASSATSAARTRTSLGDEPRAGGDGPQGRSRPCRRWPRLSPRSWSAASASPTRSPSWWSSSPTRTRRSTMARSTRSTAASTCSATVGPWSSRRPALVHPAAVPNFRWRGNARRRPGRDTANLLCRHRPSR